MIKTSVADAKARLSDYLERAERGERIVICRHNKPVAELRQVDAIRTEPRPLGPLPGRPTFTIDAAFFEPLSNLELDAWEGGAAPMAADSRPARGARRSRVAERKSAYGAPPDARTKARRSRG